MASFQKDPFLSSPESSSRLSRSLPTSIKYIYLWCILFDWDENVERPFTLYQVGMFSKKEMKPEWLSGDLDLKSRQKKMKFSSINGKSLSLYAKVEKCECFLLFTFFYSEVCIIFNNDNI